MPEKPPEGPARRPGPLFQDLYAAEFKFVWHALWRLGTPNRDLPDLTQRVLFIAYLSWADYDPTRPLKPWLLGIAYRVAADYHRLARHSHEQFVPVEMLDVMDESSDIDDLITKRELCALIEKLGRQLPEDRKRIFVQHDLEGIPIPKIARSMNIPVNTAYSRLRLARQDIRARLERHMRKRGPLRGMYFLAGVSELRDAFAKVADLARVPGWLAAGLIAAATIVISGIFPGSPLVAFPPAEKAFEGPVVPSAPPSASVKPPVVRPPAPPHKDAILDTRARLTKRLASPSGQKSPR